MAERLEIEAIALLADWVDGVLESTDPENPDSHFNDHARECAEAIAFDVRRPAVQQAVEALSAYLQKE